MIPVVLLSGLVILGVDPFWQNIVIGAMLIVAVGFDQFQRERISRGLDSTGSAARATPTTSATRGRAVAQRRRAPDGGPGSQHAGGGSDEPAETTASPRAWGWRCSAPRSRSRSRPRTLRSTGPARRSRSSAASRTTRSTPHRNAERGRRPPRPARRSTSRRPPTSPRSLQNQVIEAAAAAAPDGMVIDAVFPTEATPLIAQIIDSGIPVATIQQPVVGRGPGLQPRGAAARHGASWRRMPWPRPIGDEGKVFVIDFQAGSPSTDDRLTGLPRGPRRPPGHRVRRQRLRRHGHGQGRPDRHRRPPATP